MPATGEAVVACPTDPFGQQNDPYIFTLSDGYQLCVATNSAGNLIYSSHAAGGAWTPATTLVGALSLATTPHAIVQVGDVVHVFTIETSTTLVRRALTWNATSHAVSGVATTTYATGSTAITSLAAAWNSTYSFWCIYLSPWTASNGNTNGTFLTLSDTLTPVGSGSATFYARGRVYIAAASQSAGTIYAMWAQNGLAVQPLAITGLGTYTAAQAEFPRLALTDTFDFAFDASGNLDLIWGSASSVWTVKRTGTNLYSNSTTIATSPCVGTPVACYDAATGNLSIFFQTTAAQPNGEVYMVKRTSGTWGGPTLLVGGDASGYTDPTVANVANASEPDLLYVTGGTLYHYAVGSGAAPQAPTSVTPQGAADSLTPTVAWAYNNTVAGDTQHDYQIQVTRTSDSVLMWDSGTITSAATSVGYGSVGAAATALAWGTQYQVTVRTTDTTLLAWGPWSAPVTFTPTQPPVVAIVGIDFGDGNGLNRGTDSDQIQNAAGTAVGATSITVSSAGSVHFTVGTNVAVGLSPSIDVVPLTGKSAAVLTVGAMVFAHAYLNPVSEDANALTITKPAFTLECAHAQGANHAVNAIAWQIYDATDTTLIDSSPLSSIPNTPAGTAIAIQVTSSLLANNTTYLIRGQLTDATTGLVGTSAAWTLTTAWAAPAAPTNLAASVDADNGRVTLSWTNDASAAQAVVYCRPAGTAAWSVLSAGSLRTTIDIYPPVEVAYDYAVAGVNALGIPSALAEETGVTLGYKYGRYGVWLNDVTQPGSRSIALGLVDSWDTAVRLHHNEKVLRFVPGGRTKPISSYGLDDWWSASGRTYDFPMLDQGLSGSTTAATILATFSAVLSTHNPLLYRDPDGMYLYVTVENFDRTAIDITTKQVIFDLFEADYDAPTALLVV